MSGTTVLGARESSKTEGISSLCSGKPLGVTLQELEGVLLVNFSLFASPSTETPENLAPRLPGELRKIIIPSAQLPLVQQEE